MNIQGLEALATLASAVPAPGSNEASDGQSSSNPSTSQNDAGSSAVQNGNQQRNIMHQQAQTQQPMQQSDQQAQMFSQQMWQQLMATAGSSINGPQTNNHLANPNTLGQMNAFLGNSGNINLQRLIAQPQLAPTPAPQSVPMQQAPNVDPTVQALSMALGGMNPAFLSSLLAPNMTQPALTKQSYTPASLPTTIASPPTAALPITTASQNKKIAPQPSHTEDEATDGEHHHQDKKLQKRVANRKSAQLSRKRKKQFIEELKDENDHLRRKEQILRSIPDLVVVFDSSGKLWFVSESVNRFLDFGASDLEGTSFWNLLCSDSVRLLKAAFMDSLAAREGEASTAPLGQGFWDVCLKNNDGTEKAVSLNGVVHFAGDRPECVCSIRPKNETTSKHKSWANNNISNSQANSGNGKGPSRISDSSENGSSDETVAVP